MLGRAGDRYSLSIEDDLRDHDGLSSSSGGGSGCSTDLVVIMCFGLGGGVVIWTS